MADYSDDFNRADANDLGADWTAEPNLTMPKLVSHNPTTTGNFVHGAYYSAGTFINNQYAEVAIGAPGAGAWTAGPILRASTTDSTSYCLTVRGYADRYTVVIYRRAANGAKTSIKGVDLPGGLGFNEWIWRLEVIGNQLTAYSATAHGGTYTSQATITDNILTSGKAGFAQYNSWGSGIYTTIFPTWYGGDIVSGDGNEALTGASATSAIGSAAESTDVAASGLESTASAGLVVSPGISEVFGVAATTTVGATAQSRLLSAPGNATTTGQGSVSVARTRTLSGQQAQGSLGSLAASAGDRYYVLGCVGSVVATAQEPLTAPLITTPCHLEDVPLSVLEGV